MSGRKWTAGGKITKAKEFLLYGAELFKAVGIDPQRNGCLLSIDGAEATTKLRPLPHCLLDGLADRIINLHKEKPFQTDACLTGSSDACLHVDIVATQDVLGSKTGDDRRRCR